MSYAADPDRSPPAAPESGAVHTISLGTESRAAVVDLAGTGLYHTTIADRLDVGLRGLSSPEPPQEARRGFRTQG